ncbi:hypothetical protein PVT67_15955 [Gallaecimonas kandeliae]|uniref:hypothetical protein n=1 Tax=Gallaecimonas kandeliae TaxID=3029055 RepID=UPI0026491543|nr:hypothetical protein [Gallaecimonas kandeliae]WKE65137.1 hypothetical protein PVT67_15955 [Gallaecimonas kandeliae]
MRTLPLMSFLALVLAGCCSCDRDRPAEREMTQPSSYFSTYISEDGSKRFVFSLETQGGRSGPGMGGREGRGGRGGPGMGRSGGDRGGQQARQEAGQGQDKLLELLEEKLADNGYCRSGYIQLDSTQRGHFLRFTGECNESATDEDRKRFPNVGNGGLEKLGR